MSPVLSKRDHRGLYLFYSRVPMTMRDALKSAPEEARGLKAKILLETLMPERDYNWLMHLLDYYEDHVVEFSTYSVEFGVVLGFKTCYWEVRRY